MPRNLKSSSAFYEALRDKANQWLSLSEEEFVRRWERVDAAFDQEWLSMTSSFNADTWLIQCAEGVFDDLKARRKDVERLFFEVRGEGDFGPHLVGRDIPWASASNGTAKIVGVSLSLGLGMEYRLLDSAGRCFQIEKFD